MTQETQSSPNENTSPETTTATAPDVVAAPASAEAANASNAISPDATEGSSDVASTAEVEKTDTAPAGDNAPAVEAVSTNAEPASDEAATGEGADAKTADTEAGEAPAKKKRRRRKKKKPGQEVVAPERAPFHVGEQVFGKITAIMETAVMVDLSGKALAIFDRGEMETDDLLPEVGENFVGQVLGDGSRGGLVVLTRKPLREEVSKPLVEKAAADGALVNGLVTGVIKGGVEVLIDGLRAFAPASGVDLHPRNANLQQLVGSRIDFKVSTYEKQGREVVVTRRPMLEKEAHERRKKARELLKEGLEMQGVVRTVVDWGAFIALPEAEFLEGLVHVSELSHNPRDRVADVLKPGQKLKVKIQKIDEKGKIWLSRKALIDDPFAKLIEGINVGDVIEGDVMRVEDFGAFIKLAEGFEGLAHVSDLSVTRVEDAKEVVTAGEKLKVLVHHIDPKNRRVALHPAPSDAVIAEGKQKVAKNSKLMVEVVKVDRGGLQVRVLGATGRQARGFIPAGQTGTPRGAELKKHFKEGEKLKTLVLDIDSRRGEVKLSISRLASEEERQAHREYRAKVKAESNFGTLGDLLKRKLEQ